MRLPDKKITIISGHYGTGKTEFAVNLAIRMAREGHKITLVDLDIVNPYFRSYERKRELEKEGVEVLVTSRQGKIDIPALPAEIMKIFSDDHKKSIIDVGGDPVGARVLGYYKTQLDTVPHDFWFCVNHNRPENRSKDQVIQYIKETEQLSRQPVTGLINTTHLGRETAEDDIIKGDAFVADIASTLELPFIYTVGEEKFESTLEGRLQASFFPIRIYMIKPWELDDAKGGHFAWLEE